jgi:DNA primase
VAPLGTALTEEQVELLWRLAPEPILCFDGDAAGQRAAARALDRALPLLRPGHSLRFAMLPSQEDPDSLVRSAGLGAMRAILDGAQGMAAMLWQLQATGRALDTPERRSGFRRDLRDKIRAIADREVHEDYRAEIDRRLAEAFPAPGGRGTRPQPGAGRGRWAPPAWQVDPGGQAARQGLTGVMRLQFETVLAALLNHPALIGEHAEEVAHLRLPPGPLERLRDLMIRFDSAGFDLDSVSLKRHLSDEGLAAVADGVLARTRQMRFVHADAGPEEARAGFVHVLAVLREGDARRERDLAAEALGENPTDAALDRFQAACRVTLEGETQRRDLDDAGIQGAQPRKVRPPGTPDPAA